jgi:P-type Cu+ transporter
MKKQVFSIKDMHCANCAMRLQELEDELEGIESADASYLKQTLTVRFDDSIVDEKSIIAAVKGLGYTAEVKGPKV